MLGLAIKHGLWTPEEEALLEQIFTVIIVHTI